MVGAWGYFLIQGVHDPLGGINTLWPLFGIANQMLAAIALCFGTTVILKMQLLRRSSNAQPQGKLWYCLVTFVPMVWLVAVTYTAGIQKIAHPNPRIGFLSQAKVCTTQITKLEAALSSQAVETSQETQQLKNEIRRLRTLRFNNIVDAVVASVFLLLVTLVLAPSFREWVVLLTHRRSPSLAESTAVHVEEPKRQ
jgi:carbon starvation protein